MIVTRPRFVSRIGLTLAVGGLALAASGQAQITQDDCLGVLDSVGPGFHAYDTTLATTGGEGQNEFACESFTVRAISNDIWFEYVAASSGNATITTCGTVGTHVDSKIAVYEGAGCPVPGSALGCSDDSCGPFSSITLPVTADTTYTVQVGGFPGAPGGTGTITISEHGAPSGHPQLSNQDDCWMAEFDTIAGEGTWDWDTSEATIFHHGQSEPNCYVLGTSIIDRDIWFTWMPEVNGMATIATCNPSGGTAADTRLAVYPAGGCPSTGSSIACSDDDCGSGFLSSVTFAAQIGESYLVQIGNFPSATPGTGEVAISMAPAASAPVQNLDDCSAASTDVQIGSSVFSVDLSGATTGTQGQAEGLCDAAGSTGIENDIWFTWYATQTGVATIDTCASAGGDSKLAIYPTQGCPLNGRSIACDDDACGTLSSVMFPTVAGAGYLVQVGNSPGGAGTTFDITISESAGTGNLGTNYCENTPNSTGVGGTIGAHGLLDVSANLFFLTATNLPGHEFGYFLAGPEAGLIMNPGGSAGNFCLGGPTGFIGRYAQLAQNSGAAGAVTIRVDVNAIPIAVAPHFITLLPGDTWNFQCWFRNNGMSNFTDATSVLFE